MKIKPLIFVYYKIKYYDYNNKYILIIMDNKKKINKAAEKNKYPIYKVLKYYLTSEVNILEIASGSGQHILYFAELFRKINWQPSEINKVAIESIEEYMKENINNNIYKPIILNAEDTSWPIIYPDAIISINLMHILPLEKISNFFKNISKLLKNNSLVFIYGPFIQNNTEISESNLNFDKRLKEINPLWGIRKLEDIEKISKRFNLVIEKIIEMPANNLSIIIRKKLSN